jgi:hypothetical protein
MEGFLVYPDRNHLMDGQCSPVDTLEMDLPVIRVLLRHKLQDGRLPHHRIAGISSGPGGGGTCDGCEARITKDELMKEVVLAGGRGARGSVQFHTLCFQLWDDERHAATPAV